MKLKELKEKYEGRIKLGAKDGAAFFYCGRMDDLDMQRIEEEFTSKTLATLRKVEKAILIAESTPLDKAAYEKYSKRQNAAKYTSYSQWLEREKKKREKDIKYAERLEAKIRNYPHLAEREVLEIYKSIFEPRTAIVIIDGREVGRAWTTKEYEEGV